MQINLILSRKNWVGKEFYMKNYMKIKYEKKPLFYEKIYENISYTQNAKSPCTTRVLIWKNYLYKVPRNKRLKGTCINLPFFTFWWWNKNKKWWQRAIRYASLSPISFLWDEKMSICVQPIFRGKKTSNWCPLNIGYTCQKVSNDESVADALIELFANAHRSYIKFFLEIQEKLQEYWANRKISWGLHPILFLLRKSYNSELF